MAVEQWALAIDLGTGGPKVGLVSNRGTVLGGAFEPVALHLSAGGGAEQDPEDWWRSVTTASARVTAAHPVEAARVSVVGVTGQWAGTVPIDASGDPLAPAIIWLDHRGAAQIRSLIGGSVRIEGYGVGKLLRWIRLTGGAPGKSGKDPIAHIAWLKATMPDLYAATTTFLEPKDYLNLRLTGRAMATFDSITLHWVTDNRDIDAVAYDDRLLRRAGIDRAKLPDLIRALDIVGPLTAAAAGALGVPAGVPVIGGSPDIHSAGIGAGAVPDFSAHLYVGTSGWLSCHVPFKKTDLRRNLASIPSAIPGRYLIADEQETAGACLDHLARLLHGDEAVASPKTYAAFDAAAARSPAGARGLVFTPWLNGERSPVEDSSLRGGLFNQSLHHGRDDLIRAVFEGVAHNARWLLGAVERFAGQRLDPITMVGGGANSDLWCRIHADVLGRTVRQAERPILVNVAGIGWLALAALGHLELRAVPAIVPIKATYEPDPAKAAVYDRAHDVFRRVHHSTRRLYARINPA
ncbi:MAG: FGGY-family carbohydrate kinase [Acidimicrobiia bacterium]|nr:FGGY-family carbohydrate kinase [Acidimicrobiia bacterium]